MKINPIKCRVFRPNESLEKYVIRHISILPDESVIAITSKIVSLSQGRVLDNKRGRKTRIIKYISDKWFKTRLCYLTLIDGHWCANAGVDESNADGKIIMWPLNPYDVAQTLRTALIEKFKIEKLGVLITDSRVYPLRAGVTGVALGYAGFHGLRDYRGKTDIFGRKLAMTQTNIADTLASAAVLVMGEGNEKTPLALINDAPVEFVETINQSELQINLRDDMFSPFYDCCSE